MTMDTRYLKAIDAIKKNYPISLHHYLESGEPLETVLFNQIHRNLLLLHDLTKEELEYVFTVIRLQTSVES